MKTTKTGIDLITEERARQISKEGWTPEHDDEHRAGELAMAAVCYLLPSHIREAAPLGQKMAFFLRFWPWDMEWWKPSPENRIRECVKAGAMAAAEIDRLQRVNK